MASRTDPIRQAIARAERAMTATIAPPRPSGLDLTVLDDADAIADHPEAIAIRDGLMLLASEFRPWEVGPQSFADLADAFAFTARYGHRTPWLSGISNIPRGHRPDHTFGTVSGAVWHWLTCWTLAWRRFPDRLPEMAPVAEVLDSVWLRVDRIRPHEQTLGHVRRAYGRERFAVRRQVRDWPTAKRDAVRRWIAEHND